MNGADMISEICRTFPARDVVTDVKRHPPIYIGINTAVCPECGKKFSYWPATHVYKGYIKHSRAYFCSYSCLKAYREAHKTNIDKGIECCKKRLNYLIAQSELPQEQREIKAGLERLIESADQRLNTLLNRKARKEGIA